MSGVLLLLGACRQKKVVILVVIERAVDWIFLAPCPRLSSHHIIIQHKEHFNIIKLYLLEVTAYRNISQPLAQKHKEENTQSLRDAISKICAEFPNTYWQSHDQDEQGHKEFHAPIVKAGWLDIALLE
ncbi:hypothetical protein LB504_009193 [Fusarium proliferatum]|nr:hypothetical protein LB504_009193 [Fusarium proliferatum]